MAREKNGVEVSVSLCGSQAPWVCPRDIVGTNAGAKLDPGDLKKLQGSKLGVAEVRVAIGDARVLIELDEDSMAVKWGDGHSGGKAHLKARR